MRDLDDVTSALNFDTADCHVVGSCDLYTTKAAGSDKKLYKHIEHSLESQYENLLRFSVSLSPPEAASAAPSLNLSRSSPFGSLSQTASRRTFTYLISTLNASHPDYEFSRLLQPEDFRREKSLRLVMNTVNTTLYNLRPKTMNGLQSGPPWTSAVQSSPASGPQWSPRMWRIIDKEMHLRECTIYTFATDEKSWESEEGVIWSLNYFFHNKARKRVCYLYLRGSSLTSPDSVVQTPIPLEYATSGTDFGEFAGLMKRADFWLGDRASRAVVDAQEEVWDDGDDPRLLPPKAPRQFVPTAEESGTPFSDRSRDERSRSKSSVRGISEDIANAVEV